MPYQIQKIELEKHKDHRLVHKINEVILEVNLLMVLIDKIRLMDTRLKAASMIMPIMLGEAHIGLCPICYEEGKMEVYGENQRCRNRHYFRSTATREAIGRIAKLKPFQDSSA